MNELLNLTPLEKLFYRVAWELEMELIETVVSSIGEQKR